jgi:hypothetical protein
MNFTIGTIVVYNPNLPDLLPPGDRPRDIGRVRMINDTHAEVYFPAAERISLICRASLEPVDHPLPPSCGMTEDQVERLWETEKIACNNQA